MGIPIIGDLIDGVKDLVSEVVVDKDKRDQINLELRRLEDQAQARLDAQVLGQIEVNKVEAASGSIFVAGWRPAIGWVGAIALLYAFVLQPFIELVARWMGSDVQVPDLMLEQLIPLVMAMLGIGGMRTFEKVKGVSTNDYRDSPTRTQQGSTVEVNAEGDVKVTKKEATPVVVEAAPKKKKPKFKLF